MATETAEAPVVGRPDSRAVAARRIRLEVAAVSALVLAGFVTYAALAQLVLTPRVHPDELVYGEAAGSLASGDGFRLRGEEYTYGPLYPGAIAPALALADDRETGYALLKATNALLFALAAIPIYLLARRVLDRRWSTAVAGTSLLIPSSMFVGLVMTETLAYVVAAWVLLAIVLALERPTFLRQAAVLFGAVAAYTARPQLGALYITFLAALGALWLLAPAGRPRSREAVYRLWPTAASIAIAAAVFAAPLVGGSSPLGAYEVLWRSYDPVVVAKWFLYHLADLELYLAVIPLATAPTVLVRLVRAGRAGSTPAAAFAAVFLAANAVGILVVAVFASTEHGFDRLHDRNIFYLVPLWLVLFAVWLAAGLPRPRGAMVAGVGLAVALPALLPFRHVSEQVGVDVVTSALWSRIQEATGSGELVNGRRLLALFVVALALAAALVPRRLRLALPAAVVVVFLATAALAWERQIDAPENAVFAGASSGDQTWIDRVLPAGARVTKVYVDSAECPLSGLARHALYLTEFFNARADRAAYVGNSNPDGLPIVRVDVGPGGRLLLPSREPLVAEYVYTQPGIALVGEKLASGTAASLVLWRVGGPVAVVGATTADDVRPAGCD